MDGLDVSGDVAVEHGKWGMTVLERGKTTPTKIDAWYILVWKRQPDGKWLLARDVSIPNPAPAR